MCTLLSKRDGADQEWLVQYCRELLRKEHYDYFLFGHRHLPVDMEIVPFRASRSPAGDLDGANARYINLGDWITHFTYAVLDPEGLRLMKRSSTDRFADDVQISGGPAA